MAQPSLPDKQSRIRSLLNRLSEASAELFGVLALLFGMGVPIVVGIKLATADGQQPRAATEQSKTT